MDAAEVLNALNDHVGANNGIGAEDLAKKIVGCDPTAGDERGLRRVIADMRRQGVRICGHPSTGYFIAATADELNMTCSFLRSRAMSSLQQEARLRNIALPDLIGQLNLQLAAPSEG